MNDAEVTAGYRLAGQHKPRLKGTACNQCFTVELWSSTAPLPCRANPCRVVTSGTAEASFAATSPRALVRTAYESARPTRVASMSHPVTLPLAAPVRCRADAHRNLTV